MSGATSFYALPYPTDTDLVSQGDEAIQALAERVETILKGSGAAPRVWSISRPTGGGTNFSPGAWVGSITLTLTGCPVGALVALFASQSVSTDTAGATVKAKLWSENSTMTVAPDTTSMIINGGAGLWMNLVTFGIGTVTTASPAVSAGCFVNSGLGHFSDNNHVTAVRVV